MPTMGFSISLAIGGVMLAESAPLGHDLQISSPCSGSLDPAPSAGRRSVQAQEPGVKFQMAMWPGGLQPDQVQMVKVDRSPRGTPWMCLGCRHWAAAVWSGGGLRSKAILQPLPSSSFPLVLELGLPLTRRIFQKCCTGSRTHPRDALQGYIAHVEDGQGPPRKEAAGLPGGRGGLVRGTGGSRSVPRHAVRPAQTCQPR